MLPDSTLTVLKLERLTRLYDGLEQLEDMFGEEMSQSDDSYHEGEPEEVWAMDEHGMWMPEDAEDEDEWTDEEGIDSMDVDDEGWTASDPTAMQMSTPPSDSATLHPDDLSTSETQTVRPSSPDVPKDATDADEPDKAPQIVEEPLWKRFEVLSTAPPDHAFYNSAPAQPSRSFLGRLSKEYRVLSNSLPGTSYSQRKRAFVVDRWHL